MRAVVVRLAVAFVALELVLALTTVLTRVRWFALVRICFCVRSGSVTKHAIQSVSLL